MATFCVNVNGWMTWVLFGAVSSVYPLGKLDVRITSILSLFCEILHLGRAWAGLSVLEAEKLVTEVATQNLAASSSSSSC